MDDWRIQRQATWCIVCGFVGSKDMPEAHQLYSLPYDDELIEREKRERDDSLEEWYKSASEQMTNFKWN